jgi:hypothetical protein
VLADGVGVVIFEGRTLVTDGGTSEGSTLVKGDLEGSAEGTVLEDGVGVGSFEGAALREGLPDGLAEG